MAELLEGLLAFLNRNLSKVMWLFIIAGVVLSCMHQSGLGSLLLIAPTKMSPLWYTPILPLLFLTSAIAVGFPIVVFENTLVSASFELEDEMDILSRMVRITIVLLGIYGALKIGDVIYRGAWPLIFDGSTQGRAFMVEVLVGVVIPWLMLLFPAVRNHRTPCSSPPASSWAGWSSTASTCSWWPTSRLIRCSPTSPRWGRWP